METLKNFFVQGPNRLSFNQHVLQRPAMIKLCGEGGFERESSWFLTLDGVECTHRLKWFFICFLSCNEILEICSTHIGASKGINFRVGKPRGHHFDPGTANVFHGAVKHWKCWHLIAKIHRTLGGSATVAGRSQNWKWKVKIGLKSDNGKNDIKTHSHPAAVLLLRLGIGVASLGNSMGALFWSGENYVFAFVSLFVLFNKVNSFRVWWSP